MSRFPYHGHRFAPCIIQHVVWMYLRFTLSLRDVEDILAERGLDLTYETVRRWVGRFGPLFARELRKRRPRPTARWHLDEMVVTIAGKRHWLWRAVDDEGGDCQGSGDAQHCWMAGGGEVLDILVQSRRDTRAAARIMRKLVRKLGFAPETITTDKLRSYGAAKRKLGLMARHEQRQRRNNRAENSHQPTRRRNERCSGSNRRGPRNAFCWPMLLSTTPSTLSATLSPAKP